MYLTIAFSRPFLAVFCLCECHKSHTAQWLRGAGCKACVSRVHNYSALIPVF